MYSSVKIFILLVVIFSFTISASYADDLDPHYKFSGIKAPDSPYKNTWGAFQTDLFSGSFSYDYKIAVPPGTNGLAPQIAISYNSHSAKGKAGWVGAGWEIPLSYIQRDIEYTRKDTSDDTFDLFLEGAKHDLVYVASENLYHTKVEAYLRIEKKTGAPNETGEYWVVQTKDGTEYRFGYNTDSESRVRSSDSSVPGYVWRLSLDRIKDSNGNCIYFTYLEDQGSVYLDTITYNNDMRRTIQFVREPKPDAYLVIDQGSEVYDAYRLKEILVKVNGALVRKYALSYTPNEIGSKSLLSSITQYGADGVTALPPVRFEYKATDKGFNEGVNWATPGERRIRKTDGDNDTVIDTFDVNGDGLPDFVEYDGNNYLWNIWVNNKNGFNSSNIAWPVPSSPDGGNWDIRDVEQWIYGQQSPDTRSAPMDLNNDGYVDFLWSDHTNVMRFKINNNGNGFSPTTYSWTLPVAKACVREVVRPDGTNPNVMQDYSDINGDGLPDLVKKENNTSWHIWRNTGSSFVDYGIWPVPHIDAWLEDYTTGDPTELQTGRYDVNGDGLVDIVDAHSNPWKIYLNTGSNFLPANQWPTSFTYINDTNSSGDVKRDLIDMNGDGLPDIVNPVSGVQAWEVYFNTGKGFTSKMSWTVPAEVPENGYVNNIENSQVGREVLDINGDGLADLVRHIDAVSYWRVYSNKSGKADLLTKVTDTLGGIITANYTPSMSYANTRLPFNYWVVSSLTTNNGMSGAHANVSTTNYSYTNGLYDFPTREFRGFGQVNETKADGTKVIHSYYQDEAKKGKEYKTEKKSASDSPFAAIENVYSDSSANGIYISNLSRSDDYTYDGNPLNPKTVRKEFQNYDPYGNVGLQISYGDITASGDETYTYNDYWASCSSDPWVVDRVKHRYVKPSPTSANLRESFFWYDLQISCVTKGNLTREEHWLNTGDNPVINFEYDSYGNRTKTIDPEGRVTRVIYDPIYNTFSDETYNALNQLTRRITDPVNGEPTYVIDPNGFTMRFMYDTFYRKEKEIKPYDSEALPTVLYQYDIDGTAPEHVKVLKRETAGGGTLDTVQVIDGFANLIQTKIEAENPANMIAVDVFYDVLKRVKKQSNPYLTDNAYSYSSPNTGVPSIQYSYDTLDRPTLITNPDDTQVSRIFDHWNVTETDENGHSKNYRFDAFQRLKQVVENNASELYTTDYQYSSLGELKQITDHLNNLTTIQYDSLGRKILMNDPDLRTWTYAYDRVGNLISQEDARGVTTNIQYDPLNRKTLIDYPNDTDVQFTYDRETIGTLSQVTDSTGIVTYLYDQRLRKTEETREFDGLSWSTAWSYDSMDRVVRQTYPDGEAVDYTYNNQGSLESIPGIIPNIDYNASGQIMQKSYANGKSTTYSYNNANHRLESILTPGIQNLAYTYDNVGNIKTLQDGVEGKTETFAYDDLDRLKQAGDSGYSSQYQYNAIGNMSSMTKDGKNYSYTYGLNAGPHAVTEMTVPYIVLASFAINNGNEYTTTGQVTLNNISMGNSAEYMASEDAAFAGASWQPYSPAPLLSLSQGFGRKSVYFKVRNAQGESTVKTDSIDYLLDTDGDGIPNKYDPDDDNDGMPDVWEINNGFDPLNAADASLDSDNDGLNNVTEYQRGTDPKNSDTDSDGWSDYAEIAIYNSDPLDPDMDDDGLIDSVDPYVRNPFHYSISENYKLPQGIFNEGGDVRASETLAISDSIGDGFSKKTFIDTDDDGIPDKDDSDDDNDGIPDTWEIDHGMNSLNASDASADFDGDGLSNLGEYLNSTDLNNPDSDGDGWNDYVEIIVYKSDPLETDTDDDGVIDPADPSPVSIFHYAVSENFTVRIGNFNMGGDQRTVAANSLSDEIGNEFNRNIISVNLQSDIAVSPAAIDFGSVLIGNPTTDTIEITNTGNNNLSIDPISLSGPDVDEFNIQNDNCSNRAILPSDRCTVQIVFSPTSGFPKSAILSVPSDDPETPVVDVLLQGAGVDVTPPTGYILIESGANYTNSLIVNLTIGATDETGVSEMCLSNTTSCSNWQSYANSASWMMPLGDGNKTIYIWFKDVAGNVNTTPYSDTIILETVKPSSAIISPIDGALLIGTAFTVTGTADDGAETGIQKVEISINGGSWITVNGKSSWSYEWTISADGTYTIKSRATDNAGNVEIATTGITITAFTHYPLSISGSGYNYPEPGFRAGLSMNINGLSLQTSWLNYYYTKQRLNFTSTSITSISIAWNTLTITGTGTVNSIAGYTFVITIVDGNPDTIEIVIYNPDGTIYFQAGSRVLDNGDFIMQEYSQYQLTTSLSPSGAGSISPDCSSVCWYDNGTFVTLTASENAGYAFSGWIGCDSASNNTCTMIMDADKNVTATFDTCLSPIRIEGSSPVYYFTLQEAYDAALDGDIIQSQAAGFTEDINIDRNITVTLEGGYSCDYSARTGKTTLNGMVTIIDGVITIEDFELQ